ncbi:ISAon1 family transposase N-terminal region protein [Arenibacter certesii]|uniref:Transposase n=1 Tax=Arenibacter certesii TaxID=228955 RepID=A0A918ITX2_9FLAO|nr:hypothetical protein [Arenibacter certesii]GGW30319.1 hypothetical protein GCM10007383_14550 [Arenibacter certesii]
MDKGTDLTLLSLFLPEGILDFFAIVGFEQKPIKNPLYFNRLTVFLEEKKQIPALYKDHTYKASGFMEPRVIDDYPIRDNLVSLSLKRMRWDVLIDGKWIKTSRDWNDFIAQGTRMSKEFAAFLKEING